MGAPFTNITSICPECQKQLSKCGLTFFVVYRYATTYNDEKWQKKLRRVYKNSFKYRINAYDKIVNCSVKEHAEKIIEHANTKDSHLRASNKLRLSCEQIRKIASRLK